jgi:PAS domain S-box-containing protein
MQTRYVGDPFQITNAERLQHQIFGEVANSLQNIAWIAHADGAIEYYNRQWFLYTGLTLKQTRDAGWVSVVHPDDLPQCVQSWTSSLTTGKFYDNQFRLRRADGAYRRHRAHGAAVRDRDGNIVKWFGVAVDVEDQWRLTSTARLCMEAWEELQSRLNGLDTAVAL